MKESLKKQITSYEDKSKKYKKVIGMASPTSRVWNVLLRGRICSYESFAIYLTYPKLYKQNENETKI